MDEQNTTIQTTTATTISDLKTAFDQAVEERKIIDAKIAEIKKQIQAQRKQYEDLDKKTDIYTVTENTNTSTTDTAVPNISIPDFSVSETLKGIFHFIVKYLIPIIIILTFLGIYFHRNATHTSYVAPVEAVLTVSVEEATQTIQGLLS